jgi:hypothetical protein
MFAIGGTGNVYRLMPGNATSRSAVFLVHRHKGYVACYFMCAIGARMRIGTFMPPGVFIILGGTVRRKAGGAPTIEPTAHSETTRVPACVRLRYLTHMKPGGYRTMKCEEYDPGNSHVFQPYGGTSFFSFLRLTSGGSIQRVVVKRYGSNGGL